MSEPVIKCENVYKIFGANAQKMLQDSKGNVDAKIFQDKGCIVGVNETVTVSGEALSFLSTGIDTRVYYIKNF